MANFKENRYSEESPYLSYTDLFIGIIFIFLLLVSVLVLKFGEAKGESDKKRGEFLEGLVEELKGQGVAVGRQGETLRFSGSVMFEKNHYTLSADGVRSVDFLAENLRRSLLDIEGKGGKAPFDGIVIEGHADGVPKNDSGDVKDNFDLSVLRATAVYRQMLRAEPYLATLRSRSGESFFSTSGYGDTRPLPGTKRNANEPSNRRIELRVLPTK